MSGHHLKCPDEGVYLVWKYTMNHQMTIDLTLKVYSLGGDCGSEQGDGEMQVDDADSDSNNLDTIIRMP